MAKRGGIYGGAGQTTAGAAPTGAKGRGPGLNRGGRPGGGGGGGGGQKKVKLPGGGIYAGRAGEAQTNTDPMSFFTSMLVNSGMMPQTNTPQDIWVRDQAVKNLMDQYAGYSATNQRASPLDFMKNIYGASYEGKKAKRFNPGNLAGVTAGLPEQFGHVYANENQEAFLNEEASRRGLLPATGTPNFNTWYSTVFQPQTQTNFRVAQRNAPNLNYDDWLATQNLVGQAQRGYANRPDMLRGQSAAPEIGHWSWWA